MPRPRDMRVLCLCVLFWRALFEHKSVCVVLAREGDGGGGVGGVEVEHVESILAQPATQTGDA